MARKKNLGVPLDDFFFRRSGVIENLYYQISVPKPKSLHGLYYDKSEEPNFSPYSRDSVPTEILRQYLFNSEISPRAAQEFKYFLPKIIDELSLWPAATDFEPRAIFELIAKTDFEGWLESEREAVEAYITYILISRPAPITDQTCGGLDIWLAAFTRIEPDVAEFLEVLLLAREDLVVYLYKRHVEGGETYRTRAYRLDVSQEIRDSFIAWFNRDEIVELLLKLL